MLKAKQRQKLTKNYLVAIRLTRVKVILLFWPSQSPYLKLMENVWRKQGIRVMAQRASDLKHLELITKDKSSKYQRKHPENLSAKHVSFPVIPKKVC